MIDSTKLNDEVVGLAEKLEKAEKELDLQIIDLTTLENRWKELDEKVAVKAKEKNIKIRLNISGSIFETYLDTLVSIKDTLFYKLVISEDFNLEEEIFFDRSPKFFPVVLDYLRYKKINYRKFSNDDLMEFFEEASYYELTDIVDIMKDKIKDIEIIDIEVSSHYMYNNAKMAGGRVQDISDGNMNTGVCTNSPGWIILELNNEWEIDEIEVAGFTGNKTYFAAENGANAEIQTSINKINWTKVGNIPYGFGNNIMPVKLTKSFSRFIKFNHTSNLGLSHVKIIKKK